MSSTAFCVFLLLTHATGARVAQGSKTPRRPTKSPGKGKKLDPVMQEPSPDYHERLVHDTDSRIRHRSFTSILDILGQQALELQPDRSFTGWEWSWDAEE